VIAIPDRDVWLIVMVCVVVDFIFLGIFSGVSKMEGGVEVVDIYRPSLNHPVCVAEGSRYWIPLGLIIGLKVGNCF